MTILKIHVELLVIFNFYKICHNDKKRGPNGPLPELKEFINSDRNYPDCVLSVKTV